MTRLGEARYGEAASCFEHVTRLRPESADAWHALGLARQGEDDIVAAISAYRSALKLSPVRVDTLVSLSGALLDGGDAAAAITEGKRALALAPDHVPALRVVAAALAEKTPALAIATLGLALAQSPTDPDLYELLASTHRRAGNFDEAWRDYSAAIALPGRHAVAYYGLSLCRRFTPEDQPVIEAMRAALDIPGTNDRERSFLHFALGKVSDDLGHYQEAIRHFDDANRLWLASRPPDRRKISLAALRSSQTRGVHRLIERFDAAAIQDLRAYADRSERPVFIVGMRRSGTTLVEQILASHRDVAAAANNDSGHR